MSKKRKTSQEEKAPRGEMTLREMIIRGEMIIRDETTLRSEAFRNFENAVRKNKVMSEDIKKALIESASKETNEASSEKDNWVKIANDCFNSNDRYILDDTGEFAVPCPDIIEWGSWFDKNSSQRIVAQEEIDDGTRISTVFLGIDHGFSKDSDTPILWETLVSGPNRDEDEDYYRCSGKRKNALAMHRRIVMKRKSKALNDLLNNGRIPKNKITK